MSAVADNIEVRNVKKVEIKVQKKLNLIFYMTKIVVCKKKLN